MKIMNVSGEQNIASLLTMLKIIPRISWRILQVALGLPSKSACLKKSGLIIDAEL